MRLTLLATSLCLLAAPAAHAQVDFAVLPTSGNWTVRVQTAISEADYWDTASVELRRELTGVAVACVDAIPAETVSIVVTAALTDTPWRLRAYAYRWQGCAGEVSAASFNAAELTKAGVRAPVLVP